MFLKWQQRHQPTGSWPVADSKSEEEAKEANEPKNWVGEVAPSSISKRLRSLFKRRVDAQDADKEEQIQAHKRYKHERYKPKRANMTRTWRNQAWAAVNIAQTVPAHLRQEFSASVVNSIRAQRGQGDGIVYVKNRWMVSWG